MILLLAIGFLLMGQAPRKKTLVANEFILKDTNGKVRGKWLSQSGGSGGPQLLLLDQNGRVRINIDSSFDFAGGSGIGINNEKGEELAGLDVDAEGAQLILHDPRGAYRVALNSGPAHLHLPNSDRNQDLSIEGFPGPSVILFDKEGNGAAIGSADIANSHASDSHKTSAASIALFDKDMKVLWKAP